jgi:cell division protein FtsW (lipid II flippase)
VHKPPAKTVRYIVDARCTQPGFLTRLFCYVPRFAVKMRAMSTADFLSPNFFIVMDRLYETLGEKMQVWSSLKASHKGGLFGMGANRLELEQLMVERLIVAYDLAAAFWYMHDHK